MNNQQWQTQASWKNPNWKYINAASTNIAKTIARVRKEMQQLRQGNV